MSIFTTFLKAAAAIFMFVVLVLLLQLDLTAFSTVEVLAPGWGWLAFTLLLALEVGALCRLGLAWFARGPRLVLRDDPSEAERQAFARELTRRLRGNPHVMAAGLSGAEPDFLPRALDVLDARAGEAIRQDARRVFLGTALSQNGRLDALIVFFSLARMVWRVSAIYNQRPSPAELWSVYSAVSSATFISFSIDALDIPQTITESMGELLPAVAPALTASSMPLVGPMLQQCTAAVIDGAANCLLAVRAGVVTRGAFRFAALGRDEARRQACIRETGTMLAEISHETVGAIVTAFRQQLQGLAGSMGRKVSERVGGMADAAATKTREAAETVVRGTVDCAVSAGQAVSHGAGVVGSGAEAVMGAGQAVAGAVSHGAGVVAGAVGGCVGSAGQAVLRGGSAVADVVGSGAGAVVGAGQAVAGAVSPGAGVVAGAVGGCVGSAGQAVLRGGSAVADVMGSGAEAVVGAGQAVAGAVSHGAGVVAGAVGQGADTVLGAVRGIWSGKRRESTADERFALRLALIWSQGRPGWAQRRRLARYCTSEGVGEALRALPDREPDLDLLEPALSFWRGRVEEVLACAAELPPERDAAVRAWLAALDARLGLGGRLQGGTDAGSRERRSFWKRG